LVDGQENLDYVEAYGEVNVGDGHFYETRFEGLSEMIDGDYVVLFGVESQDGLDSLETDCGVLIGKRFS
jgi:hypothetical protein